MKYPSMASLLTCTFASSGFADDDFPQFDFVVIDDNVGRVCYAVTLADVDGAGRLTPPAGHSGAPGA